MIGSLNAYIKVLERKEVATRPSHADDTPSSGIDWDGIATHTTGETITYDVIWETWADVEYVSPSHEYMGRAIGKSTGDTRFTIRMVEFDVEKDFYVDWEGRRYKVVGIKYLDKKRRYLVLDTDFITKDTDNA